MVIVHMPEVAESVVEGTIARWLKREGDRVTEYEALVEVVTDKVTVEIPSPATGTLTKILAQADTKVPVGATIAQIEEEAPVGAAAPSFGGGAGGDASAPEWVPIGRGRGVEIPGTEASETQPRSPGRTASPNAAAAMPQASGAELRRNGDSAPPISPLARRLASEHGVDLDAITGTGLGGRVRKQDILQFVASRQAPAAVASQPAPAPPLRAGPLPSVARGEGGRGPALAAGDVKLPVTPVRAMIAQHMVQTMRDVPHAWTSFQVDVTKLAVLRDSWKEKFQQREGVPLTYLPFFIKAAVEALKEHPALNSVWGGDHILLKKDINVSVAIDREEGLIVPVLRHADRHSIAGLALELDRLIRKAKENKLGIDDVQGGTFTVNNTGSMGCVISVPIINAPQTAILATEAIVKQPVVIGDAIAIRSMMNLSISFDHRVLDGGQVGRFMQAVKRSLESYGPETKVY